MTFPVGRNSEWSQSVRNFQLKLDRKKERNTATVSPLGAIVRAINWLIKDLELDFSLFGNIEEHFIGGEKKLEYNFSK